jgi:hypothetical protein
MLSQNQCERLLKQAESSWTNNKSESTKGWLQALRLVLEVNGPSKIRNTPLEEENE